MKRFGKVLVAVTAAVALVGIGSTVASAQQTDHCPDHQALEDAGQKVGQGTHTITVDGVEIKVVVNGPNVSFFDSNDNPIVVEFCMKASTEQSGKRTGSSGTVDFENPGGQIPDISYVVVYKVVDEEPPDNGNGDEEEEDEEHEEEVKEEEREEEEPEPAVAVVVEPVFTG